MTPPYFKGHVRAPNKDHLQQLSHARHGARLQAMVNGVNPPSSWDSRTQGIVGPIKDQGRCGSCWDFSGVGVVEIAFNRARLGGGPASMVLSEEYILSCSRNGGCGGDDNTTVLQWAKKTGLPLTSAYGPYTASADRCRWQQGQQLYKIDDWGFANASGDTGQSVTPTADIKAAIMAYGCVGCAIAADDAYVNARPGEVFDRTTSTEIDHDIIIVGWDDAKGSKGAWLQRGSWSTSWCDAGYGWIGYGVNLVGTEAVWAVVVNPNPPPPANPWNIFP